MTDKLIGTDPNQVSTNGMLGELAFMGPGAGFTPMRWHTRSVAAQLNTTAENDVGFYAAPNYGVPTEASVLQFTTLPTTTHLFCWYKIGGSSTSNFPVTQVINGYLLLKTGEYDNSTDLNSTSGYTMMAPTFRLYNTSTIYNQLSTIDPQVSWANATATGRAHGRSSQDHYAWSDMQMTHFNVAPDQTYHFKARVSGGAGNMRRAYMLIVAEVNMSQNGFNERNQANADGSSWNGIIDGDSENERTL